MIWNREVRRIAIILSGMFLGGVLVMNLCMGVFCNQVRAEYNSLLADMFGNVLAAYPEVEEEELVMLLNSQDNREYGAKVLARYGVLEEYGSASFTEQENRLLALRRWGNGFLTLFFLMIAGVFYLYLRKRQNKITGLVSYMEALNRNSYKLEVEDNADDELSGLRNEIYKLTVLLKEQADRALEQKRALADAMADISHQLKTPLTSVTVLMDNLTENDHMDEATRHRFMAEITRQLTGMSWLITAMLKLSRLDAGVVELEATSFGAEEFVRETLGRLELAAEWREVSFSVGIPDEMVLRVDRKWTGEALLNIIKNAVEHSPAGSSVEISGEENEIYAQIVVRDYGEGIRDEEREKLFRRFYNGNSVREDSIGIGLALAKEIVEKQEGHVMVDSKVGEGTVFILRFLKYQ